MKFLNMQATQLQEEINEKQDKILLINSMIKHLNAQKESSKYTVTAKKIPQRRVIYLRAQIKQYQDETLLWKRLSRIVRGQNVRLSYPHFNITVFTKRMFKIKGLILKSKNAFQGIMKICKKQILK